MSFRRGDRIIIRDISKRSTRYDFKEYLIGATGEFEKMARSPYGRYLKCFIKIDGSFLEKLPEYCDIVRSDGTVGFEGVVLEHYSDNDFVDKSKLNSLSRG